MPFICGMNIEFHSIATQYPMKQAEIQISYGNEDSFELIVTNNAIVSVSIKRTNQTIHTHIYIY